MNISKVLRAAGRLAPGPRRPGSRETFEFSENSNCLKISKAFFFVLKCLKIAKISKCSNIFSKQMKLDFQKNKKMNKLKIPKEFPGPLAGWRLGRTVLISIVSRSSCKLWRACSVCRGRLARLGGGERYTCLFQSSLLVLVSAGLTMPIVF